MSIQYTKEQLKGTVEGVQNQAEEFKETFFGDKEWHEGLGGKAWYPIKKLGEAQDFTNEQVNLRNILRIGTNVTDKIPGQWDEKILDYSYKDLRDHAAGGFGNVVGALTGSERANDAAEILGQVLLPDAVDFIGGVGYIDNLAKLPKALKKISAQDGSRIVEEVFSLPRLKAVAGNVQESVYENARKIKDTVTAPIRTVQGLVGPNSMVANIGQGLEKEISTLGDTIRRNSKGKVVGLDFTVSGGRRLASKAQKVPGTRLSKTGFEKQGDDLLNLLKGEDDFFTTQGINVGIDELKDVNYASKTIKRHHKAPLKQVASSLNYLTDEGMVKGAEYLTKHIGHPIGDLAQQASPQLDKFHNRLHGLMNARLGHQSHKRGLVGILEDKYFGDKRLADGISLQERIDSGFLKEVADVIVEQEEAIDVFWRALNNKTEIGKLSREEYVESSLQLLELDDALKAIPSKKSQELGYTTASEILNTVLKRNDFALENAINLVGNAKDQKTLYTLLAKDNGLLSVFERAFTNKSGAEVLKKYGGIPGIDGNELERIVKSMGATDLLQHFSYNEVENFLSTGWSMTKPSKLTKVEQLEQIVGSLNADDLLKKGWSITDVETAVQAGWPIIFD